MSQPFSRDMLGHEVAACGPGAREAATAPRTRTSLAAYEAPAPGWLGRLFYNLAPHDWYLGGYFVVLFLALALGSGPDRPACLLRIAVDVACFTSGIALTRGRILPAGTFLNGLVYRLTIFLSVFLSYFQLKHVLPAVSSRSVDASIFAFDMRVFHLEPSLAWDRFVNASTTEWFAFFYFGYFFVLTLHVVPIMLGSQSPRRLAHFATGIVLVFCTGHLVYMLVPGYGPYRYLAPSFQHELQGGVFWQWVQATVQAGGAQKDIFPSLHTAAPTFFTLYSFRYRKVAPFKYTWPLVAFATSQIICATMFLRWHYLIDIVAGLTLATVATVLGEALVVFDERLRTRRGAWVEPSIAPLDFSRLRLGARR